MTKPRNWWIRKEESGEFLIQVDNGSQEGESLKHIQRPHRQYSAVKSTAVYSANSIKVFFQSLRDHPRVFQTHLFRWNSTETSQQLRPFTSDVSAFTKKLNSFLGVPSSAREVVVDVHRNASQDGQDMSVYEWSDDATSEQVSPSAHSTPARREKRSIELTEEIPVLFKKKAPDTQLGSEEETIMEEVRRAYLGSAKVSTAHLTLGPKLRELRESFVSELMVQMRAFPGHLYQPLCVIIDTLDDVSHFRENNANGFHYKVIGGCHNFTAAVRLSELDPSEDVFKTRMCSIYRNDLSEEALLWLANRHNKVGEYRHHLSFTEKIQLCRYMFESVGKDKENRSWHSTVTTILGDGHSKGVLKLLCKLAEMEDETYNLLQSVLSLFGDGKLKGQKLSADDLVKGPQMKPYILVELPGLPPVASQKLLMFLIKGEMTLAQFQKEAKLLQKLQTVQRMFLDLMGLRNWEEASRRFPEQTKREVLEHFAGLSLRKTPVELKNFCNRLRTKSDDWTGATFQGKMGAVGLVMCCDAVLLSEDVMTQLVPQFTGAELTILDKPKDWGAPEVKSFFNVVTSLNLNRHLEVFNVVVLCEPTDIVTVQKAIDETQHFQDVMAAFYAVPCGKQTATLNNCVHGMVLARKKTSACLKSIVWQSGSSDNFLVVERDGLFCHDEIVVDMEQKPIAVYKELILALTLPGQWVIDACCGTGTGMIAAMHQGRNVIGIEKNEDMLPMMDLRVAGQCKDKDEPGSSAEIEEEECEAEEEENIEEDAT